MNHVPIRTTAKRQVEAIAKSHQVREGVVLTIMEHAADVADPDLGHFGCAGDRGQPNGNQY